MIEKIEATRRYLDYLEEHYMNVQKAWQLVKDKCQDMNFINDDYQFFALEHQIKLHDDSKLSEDEFTACRQYYYPAIGDSDQVDIDYAWQHHLDNNNHHWQNWVHVTCSYPDVIISIVHTVVDWIAMGFKFKDDAQDYYENSKGLIKAQSWAEDFIYEIFCRVYPEKHKDGCSEEQYSYVKAITLKE